MIVVSAKRNSVPTATVTWSGSKTDPDSTGMTVGGLKRDGSTAHDNTISYDVTFTTHQGTYTITNVTRGTSLSAGDIANVLSNTGVDNLSGTIENFTYSHPDLVIPTFNAVGSNDELIVGSQAAGTPQFGVDVTVRAYEAGFGSTQVTTRSYFHTYLWDNGESSGDSGVSPWTPNGEDGLPTTPAGFWYVEGVTGIGTLNPIGPSANYIFELDNNNHGGAGGSFNPNLHFNYIHGQDTLEIEVDGVYLDAVTGASITTPVLGNSEFESGINWAETQALGTNGATLISGAVGSSLSVKANDTNSVLFGVDLPGTVNGANYGTGTSNDWGGWYELQNTQAILGRIRMQDPETGEYHIWYPAVYTR